MRQEKEGTVSISWYRCPARAAPCTVLYSTVLYSTVLHSTVQVSSPGRPLPVKFDFNAAVAVAGDPSIACPVPLRVSPDSPAFHHESSGT